MIQNILLHSSCCQFESAKKVSAERKENEGERLTEMILVDER